jgi:hypothetical protein
MPVISDFNNVRISSIISSGPPLLLAYLREWQEVRRCPFSTSIPSLNVFLRPNTSWVNICSSFQTHHLTTFLQGCIGIAISYISWAIRQDADPFTDRISNTILNTVLSFPVPRIYQPVWPWPNDAERIIQRRVLTEEPQMKALIAELDGANRVFLDEAANRMRAQLPLLPGFFKDWEPEKWVD